MNTRKSNTLKLAPKVLSTKRPIAPCMGKPVKLCRTLKTRVNDKNWYSGTFIFSIDTVDFNESGRVLPLNQQYEYFGRFNNFKSLKATVVEDSSTERSTISIEYSYYYNPNDNVEGLSFVDLFTDEFGKLKSRQIYPNNSSSVTIHQWGGIPFSGGNAHFRHFNGKIETTENDIPTFLPNTNLGYCFADVGPDVTFGNIGNWDTSNVTKMSNMFYNASTFNEDIGNWDTSNVTHMSAMFQGASKFDQYIGNWDTSNVKYMSCMFKNASDFDKDIGNWDTGNVLQMFQMFHNAESFNQDIGNWDTSNVKIMGNMFYLADKFDQDLSKWDTCSMTISNLPWSFYGMFASSGLSKTNAEALIQQWGRNGDANKTFMFRDLPYANSTIGTSPTVVITNGTPSDNFFKAC